MQLYDSVGDAVGTIQVGPGQAITIYCCGVTPYDTSHMGHARVFLVFDALVRYLRSVGATVRYCQNVTDVDDPLFRKAEQLGMAWDELARRETARQVAAMDALGALRPDYFPNASDEIERMIPLIQTLLDKGLAYARGGSVYYRIAAFPSFAAYTGMAYTELLATANERGNNPDDPHKDDPLDFVLWQAARAGEPAWPSPWGPGRPGWHIECSTMAMTYLGEQITIHGGGADLRFPHHACEIAQSEGATGKAPFAQFWMHVGMVYLDGQKMSKSLGNMVFVDEALARYRPAVLRAYLLSTHYRAPLDYRDADVAAWNGWVDRLHAALDASSTAGATLDPQPFRARFDAALDDDFGTPGALQAISDLAGAILEAHDQRLGAAQEELRCMARALGLLQH
jgi:L-cysteine:1D-myo-inositol 2-amino-2-deoxy-alpha-D-glucopyranoside ligase